MDIAVATPLDDVVAAVAVLRDPSLPGEPWTAAEIAAALPDIAELAGDGSLTAPATTLRWIAAIDAGAELPE